MNYIVKYDKVSVVRGVLTNAYFFVPIDDELLYIDTKLISANIMNI